MSCAIPAKKRDGSDGPAGNSPTNLSRQYACKKAVDYNYSFKDSEAILSTLELRGGCVQLPPVEEGNYTAFLKIHVKTTLAGKFLPPYVEIHSREQSDIQYFDQGAKGTRYVNVSSFVGATESTLALRAKHVEVDEGQVELVRFRNKMPCDPTILVVAPHPDDAEIAAYGLYSDIKDAYIVTITAGDAGTYNYKKLYLNPVEHFLKKGKLRTWNSITIPMLCGLSPNRSVNLGFFDETIKTMYFKKDVDVCGVHTEISDINTFRRQNISSLAAELDGSANWISLVDNLARLLKKIAPDIIVAPHPVLDKHDDHRFSSVAVLEAIQKAEMVQGHLYLYVNHFRSNNLYPHGRIGSLVSLPPDGEAAYFSSVYSHTLSLNKRKDKMLVMESMNDLRLNTDRRFSAQATLAALKAPLKDLLGYDDSYYRRAARRNELFFVVDIKDIFDKDKLDLLMGIDGDNSTNKEGEIYA